MCSWFVLQILLKFTLRLSFRTDGVSTSVSYPLKQGGDAGLSTKWELVHPKILRSNPSCPTLNKEDANAVRPPMVSTPRSLQGHSFFLGFKR